MSSSPVVPSKQATSCEYETPYAAAADRNVDSSFSESDEEANRLDKFRDGIWNHRFDELRRYKVDHGNLNVPRSYGGTLLSAWVDEQRSNYQLMKEGKPSSMTDDRIRQLESIGFQWSNDDILLKEAKGGQTFEEKWNERFHELEAYKAKHGHCNVSTKSGKLGNWVKRQREQYRLSKEGKSSSMTDERVQKLELIGFQWYNIGEMSQRGKSYEVIWNVMFHELEAYKVKHGHCNVQQSSGKLGRWVNKQRKQYRSFKEGKSSPMTDERVRQLESIGFQWSLYVGEVVAGNKTLEKMWDARFHELFAFKVKHGHCNVPSTSGKLGTWVRKQRHQHRLFKEGKPSPMTKERVQKLESIGFQWSISVKKSSSRICPFMQTNVSKNDAAAQESVLPMDDDHCRVAVASSNNHDEMVDQADDDVVSYDPPIVMSSQGGSGEKSEFRPFLLGTGYC